MKKQKTNIKAFLIFRPHLEDALELASALVADGLKGRSLPKSRREAIERMAKFGNGQTGDLGLSALAEHALAIWDQVASIRRLQKRGNREALGGACVTLGVMLRDFEQAARGKATGVAHAVAHCFWKAELDAGRDPTSDEVCAYLAETLEFKTKNSSFATTYSKWRKRWERELKDGKV